MFTEENDSLRNFDDNSIGQDSLEVKMQELVAFEQSNDNNAINNMYWTELRDFKKAWSKHVEEAKDYGIDWKYNPSPAMKANRFYTKAFGERI